MKNENIIPLNEEFVLTKIYVIRGKKVMLDRDLASLYEIETRRLKEQVRRNIERFPDDFMFELTPKELSDWMSQFATSKSEIMGMRNLPFVFTEHGVLMLSSVLSSSRAVQVNIQIMRIFTRMRSLLQSHRELTSKLDELERKVSGHDSKISEIFHHLRKLISQPMPSREPIGFKIGKDTKE